MSPYFRGEGEIASNFAENLTLCCNQTAQHMKTGKYSFERGIITQCFGENYTSLLLPVLGEAWQIHCTSFM